MAVLEKLKLDTGKLSEYRNEIYGFSILWIMLFHGFLSEVYYFVDVPVLKHVGHFITYGNMGVEVFLFLSGVSLYFSFSKNSDAYAFIRKRFLRIYPPLFLIFGPYLYLQYTRGKVTVLSAVFFLSALRFWFTAANANWFISLILVCYLFYPYIYGFIFKRETWVLFRAVMLALLAFEIAYLIYLDAPEIYENIEIALTRFPVFILGCGFGKMVYDKKKLPVFTWLILIGSLAACFYVLELDILEKMGVRYIYMAGGIPIAFLASYIAPLLGRYIRWFLRFLGGISLELYIMHLVMKNVYQQGYLYPYVPGDTRGWLGVLLISIVLAYLVSLVESIPRRVRRIRQKRASAGEKASDER